MHWHCWQFPAGFSSQSQSLAPQAAWGAFFWGTVVIFDQPQTSGNFKLKVRREKAVNFNAARSLQGPGPSSGSS
jgi:hypothetical protein